MRKVFVSLALIAIIVSATMLPEVKQRTQASFAKLHKTRMGKNIITAIQLELSSKNQENVVVRILALLNELLNDTTTQEKQAQSDLESTVEIFDSARESYESQISSKQADVSNSEQQLPNLNAELDSDESNLEHQQEISDRASQDLSNANDINDVAVAAFDKSVNNHNKMIDALNQARALIVQLQSSAFLQKNNAVLAQIQNHKATALKSLEGHQNKALFSLLMQMAQDVGIQADQELVANIIEVIDDLLQNEKDGLDAETQAENERVSEYNARVDELNGITVDAIKEISELNSEITRLGNEISDTQNNNNSWEDQIAELQDILEQHNQQYQNDIDHFNSLISDLNDEIEIIKEAIAIFEGQAIQDIKPVVDDLAYSD